MISEKVDRHFDIKELVSELIKRIMESNAEIAEEIGITKSTVSKYTNQRFGENFNKKQWQKYMLSCIKEPMTKSVGPKSYKLRQSWENTQKTEKISKKSPDRPTFGSF
jgi:predicted transcriptional regulator